MQALLPFPAPTPELSEELAHRLIKGRNSFAYRGIVPIYGIHLIELQGTYAPNLTVNGQR